MGENKMKEVVYGEEKKEKSPNQANKKRASGKKRKAVAVALEVPLPKDWLYKKVIKTGEWLEVN